MDAAARQYETEKQRRTSLRSSATRDATAAANLAVKKLVRGNCWGGAVLDYEACTD